MNISRSAIPQYALPEAPDVVSSVATYTQDDSHVYVHCHCNHPGDDLLIRIWKTTFLVDKSSGSKSSLIHAENISLAPVWTVVPANKPFSFLIIFSSLPRACRTFDFVEEISQPGGFEVRNIARNETDVYHINLF